MYYVGQLVAITGAQLPAIVIGYDKKETSVVWVYFPIITETDKGSSLDFDAGIEDEADLVPITEQSKDTVTGQKIFFGDFCTHKTNYPETEMSAKTKEVEAYLKKVMKWKCFLKPKEDQTVFKRGK